MTLDPFANEATEENFVPETKDPSAKPVVVGNDGKVVVTLKGGTGFDSPWIVIHASDIEDAHEQLHDATLQSLIERATKVGKFFAGKSGGDQAPPQRSNTPAHQEAPGGEKKYCTHGEMTFRSGMSKQGKAYKGFFCPTPQGTPDQCKPQFLN